MVRRLLTNLSFYTLLFGLLFSHPALASTASITVNPAVVAVDKTVTLNISIDAEEFSTPDLSVLKENFQILKKSNSTSVNNANGITLITQNWVLILLPLKTGELTIPAISIGSEKTPTLSLKVTEDDSDQAPIKDILEDANPSTENTDQEATEATNKTERLTTQETSDTVTPPPATEQNIIIKVETSPQDAYVQGQILLTQKIYHAIPLRKANLSPPTIKGGIADVVTLSTMDPYYWNVNGKRYHVIERNYAIFPKYSGSLKIEAAEFSGEAKNQPLEDPFGLQTKTTLPSASSSPSLLTATAQAITLNIMPQEASYTADNWLPAKNITLYRKWSTSVNKLQSGDSVILQTSIIADGLRAEQLPDIYMEIPDGIKAYPESAELTNTTTDSGITGVWSQKITLLLSQAGEHQIPRIQLPWWNITTEREELAELKEELLLVKQSEVIEEKNNVVNNSESMKLPTISEVETPTASLAENLQMENKIKGFVLNRWYFLLPVLFVFGLLLYRNKSKKTSNGTGNPTSNPNNQADSTQLLMENLKQACLNNNPEEVGQLLPKWARHIASIHPSTLEGISKAHGGYLRSEIEQLSQSLYARSHSKWKGVSLWDAIKKYPYPEHLAIKKQGSRLQDMYPS